MVEQLLMASMPTSVDQVDVSQLNAISNKQASLDIILQSVGLAALIGMEVVLFLPKVKDALGSLSSFQALVYQIVRYAGITQAVVYIWSLIQFMLASGKKRSIKSLKMNNLVSQIATFINFLILSPMLSLLDSKENVPFIIFKYAT